jgi:hypothetical protein
MQSFKLRMPNIFLSFSGVYNAKIQMHLVGEDLLRGSLHNMCLSVEVLMASWYVKSSVVRYSNLK